MLAYEMNLIAMVVIAPTKLISANCTTDVGKFTISGNWDADRYREVGTIGLSKELIMQKYGKTVTTAMELHTFCFLHDYYVWLELHDS